jgi:hypothetical protein
LLFYAGTIHDLIGSSILGAIFFLQVARTRSQKKNPSPEGERTR